MAGLKAIAIRPRASNQVRTFFIDQSILDEEAAILFILKDRFAISVEYLTVGCTDQRARRAIQQPIIRKDMP